MKVIECIEGILFYSGDDRVIAVDTSESGRGGSELLQPAEQADWDWGTRHRSVVDLHRTGCSGPASQLRTQIHQ